MDSLNRGIGTDLDALFDTRLTTLYRHFPQHRALWDEMVLSDAYHERTNEAFGPISHEEFQAAYAKRDYSLLTTSMVTPILAYVYSLLQRFHVERIQEPMRRMPCWEINTYPYDFSDDELTEMQKIFEEAVGSQGIPCIVRMLYRSPEELTTQYCSDNYTVMFKYDWWVWMEAQTENFKQHIANQMTLVSPAVFFRDPPDKQTMRQFVDQHMHPLMVMQELAKPLVKLTLLDAYLFSIEGYRVGKKLDGRDMAQEPTVPPVVNTGKKQMSLEELAASMPAKRPK